MRTKSIGQNYAQKIFFNALSFDIFESNRTGPVFTSTLSGFLLVILANHFITFRLTRWLGTKNCVKLEQKGRSMN